MRSTKVSDGLSPSGGRHHFLRRWASRCGYAATYFGDADAQYELGQLFSTPHPAIRAMRRAGCNLPLPRAIAAPKSCSRDRSSRGRRRAG